MGEIPPSGLGLSMNKTDYIGGVRDSVPVGLGYFSVSFGFGALAASQGVRALDATLISLTNLTSAGQFAGLTLLLASASVWEMILTTLVINSRYALMSLALSQRMGTRIGLAPRFAIAFFNTDEIFALAMAHEGTLTTSYLLGLGALPIVGWTGGTLLGALAGSVLPTTLRTCLGVMLYGMFIAIVVPPAKQERSVLVCAMCACGLSCLMTYCPGLKSISSGVSIILCTLAAAAFCAWRYPVEDEA